MRLRVNESRNDSLKAKMYFIQKIEELIKKYALPDELNYELFDGRYFDMTPDHFYRMPIPVLKTISERMEKYYAESGLEQVEESLKESYSKDTPYRIKKGANVNDLGNFFDNVYAYKIIATDDKTVIPWNADLAILGNGQIEVRGLATEDKSNNLKVVVDCDVDSFSETYRIVFDEDPEEIDEEVFNTLFEQA